MSNKEQDKRDLDSILLKIHLNLQGDPSYDVTLDRIHSNNRLKYGYHNCITIAKAYLKGNTLVRNEDKHYKWLKKAKKLMYQSRHNNPEIFLLLAKYHYFYDKDRHNNSNSLDKTKKYCLKILNNHEALYLLGCISLIDQMKYSIKERNYQNSLDYFQSSAKMGNKDAEYQVKMVSSMIN